MITKLRLINWKSFKDSTVYIDPLTILIGVNASGKSNVLDALEFLKQIAMPNKELNDAIDTIRGGKDWLIKRNEEKCLLEMTFVYNEKELVLSTVISKNSDGTFEHFGYITLDSKIYNNINIFDFFSNKNIKIWSNVFATANIAFSWNPDLEIISKYAKEICETLQNIFVFNPVPEKMRGYSPVSSELKPDGSNIAGVIASLPKDEKEKLEAELTKYVSPLPEKDIRQIQSVTVGLNNSDAMLYCYEEWNPDKPIDARGMSDGTLRFAAIVLALLTAKPHSLLVIEEIDNGLHPSRAKELVKVMKELSQKRSVDILCTTHNPVLINELGNDMIPFISYVKRDSEGNSVIELLEEKDNLAKLMASSTIGGIMTEDKL